MPNSMQSAGAWLSGGLEADFKPVSPPGAGHKPVSPPGSGHKPVSPPQGFSAEQAAPDAGASGAVFPLPWDGADPDWVYTSQAALLAQALRKSRAKVVRVGDKKLTEREIKSSHDSGRPARGSDLWRWDPQFRIETVVCELAGRFVIHERTLFHLDPPAAGAATLTLRPVFSIGELGAMPDEQVDKVLRAAVEREDRLPEILSQADDFWPFYESVTGIRLAAAPRFRELLSVAQDWGMRLLMGLKHRVAMRRPMQWSSKVMPVIATPGHGSLPSGHATVAALNAELLRKLLYSGGDALSTQRSEALDRLARRIAFNRVVAGVHFPVDSLVGYALGTQLARILYALSGADDELRLPELVDDARIVALDGDTRYGNALLDKVGRELREDGTVRLDEKTSGPLASPAPAWAELWKRSVEELADLRV